MTHKHWQKVSGVVRKGHGIASGMNSDSPYPRGSIELQTPFFKERGLDLEGFYPATINVDISPYLFELFNPSFKFELIKWHENAPAETFSLSDCLIEHEGSIKPGYVYYPHPETKIAHFQGPSTVEIIAEYLEKIYYGTELTILLNPAEINLYLT